MEPDIGSEKSLPQTLKQEMNEDDGILTFQNWRGSLADGILAGALATEGKDSIYDKQRARFTNILGSR